MAKHQIAEKAYQDAQAKTKEAAKVYGHAQAQLALQPSKPADKPSDKPANKPDKPADKPSDKSDKPADKPSDKPDTSDKSDKPSNKSNKSNGASIDKPNWMKPEKLAQQGPINKPSPALPSNTPYVPKHDRKTLPETGDHASLLASFGALLLSSSLFLLSTHLIIFKKNKA